MQKLSYSFKNIIPIQMDNQRWSAYQSDYSTNPTINSGLPPPYPAPNSIPAQSYQVGNEQHWRPRQNGANRTVLTVQICLFVVFCIFFLAMMGWLFHLFIHQPEWKSAVHSDCIGHWTSSKWFGSSFL